MTLHASSTHLFNTMKVVSERLQYYYTEHDGNMPTNQDCDKKMDYGFHSLVNQFIIVTR